MLAAYAMLASSMALVGANVPVAKLLAEALPIPLIACLRCLLATLVLWPLMRSIDRPLSPPSRGVLRNLFSQAAFGTALYNAGLLAGLRFTSALEGGLVLATLPAVVAIGSALWLGERLGHRGWAAAGLAVVGMAAINAVRAGGEGEGSLLGNALVFAGVVGEAVYVLLAKRIAGRVGVLTASFWMQLFSFLQLTPFAAASLPWLAWDAVRAGVVALLVFHSLTASVLCLLLWYGGLRRAPASVAGVFTAFLPATAAVLGVLVLGERFTLAHGVGLALMLGSILLATWPSRGAR
ncbi:DMT family transporter [Elioraea thermophila]|uniref:DMT family transporter n=1 Tax=Elioraea thermophila TaxID=2185104 RepID=UPI000DF1C612|nr:DMT family transporter [Elioraea thermophila]